MSFKEKKEREVYMCGEQSSASSRTEGRHIFSKVFVGKAVSPPTDIDHTCCVLFLSEVFSLVHQVAISEKKSSPQGGNIFSRTSMTGGGSHFLPGK